MLIFKTPVRLMHIRTHLAFAIITFFIAFFTSNTLDAQYTGFPSLDETDGKFLSIAGNKVTGGMNDQTVYLWIRVPGGQTTFELSIFDGDQSGYWDITQGNANVSNWRLSFDPDEDGNGNGLVSILTSSEMSDNDWTIKSYQTNDGAKTADGNFLYLLTVSWDNPNDSNDLNGFKVRSTGQVSYVLGKTFAVIGAPINTAPQPGKKDTDGPGADNDLFFSYDGHWRFFFWVPEGQTKIILAEGDADHGNSGDPPDDNFNAPELTIPPDIRYEILSPDGTVIFPNVQPSGDMEDENDLVEHEHNYGGILPSGLYTWHWYGQDAHNQTIMKATYELFPDPPTPQGIDIFPDNAKNAQPGEMVEYNHTVSNKSNNTRVINLVPSSSMGWQVSLYAADGFTPLGDIDGDGKKDVGYVAGNASKNIIVKVQVPSYTTQNTVDVTTITASAKELQIEVFDSVSDTTTVISPPVIQLIKGVDKNTEKPGGTLAYSIEVRNNGGSVAYNIVVIDVIPTHTTYVVGSAYEP